jgi:hypothetical protein
MRFSSFSSGVRAFFGLRGAVFAGLAAAGLTLAPGAAEAQLFGWGFAHRFSFAPPAYDDPELAPRGMPPGAVYRMLRSQGYRALGPLMSRGRVYLADVADGETGQHERLIIDAFSGDIVESYPLSQRFAPPGLVPRAPRAEAPPPAPQRSARLHPPSATPHAEPADPLVIPGIGAAAKPRPALRAKAPRKPKAVIARRAPTEPAKTFVPKTVAPPAPAAPPLTAPAEAAKPAAPEAPVAAAPPAAPLPLAAPAPAPQPAASAPSIPEDMPVAPLDDAGPPKPKSPVNDIPVAPLE